MSINEERERLERELQEIEQKEKEEIQLCSEEKRKKALMNECKSFWHSAAGKAALRRARVII